MNTTPQAAPKTWPARVAADLLAAGTGIIRLLPRPPNIAPISAMSLLGGARQPLWQALLTPLLVMAITDVLLLKFQALPAFDPFVYGSFVAIALLGRWLLRDTRSLARIGGASLLASTLFFLVTNFGVWYMSRGKANALYAPTLDGLLICYRQGLYFFGLTVVGDLGFCFVLFGAYDWLTKPAFGAKRAPVEEIAR